MPLAANKQKKAQIVLMLHFFALELAPFTASKGNESFTFDHFPPVSGSIPWTWPQRWSTSETATPTCRSWEPPTSSMSVTTTVMPKLRYGVDSWFEGTARSAPDTSSGLMVMPICHFCCTWEKKTRSGGNIGQMNTGWRRWKKLVNKQQLWAVFGPCYFCSCCH